MSHLLESIKLVDGEFRNLHYHEQRMNSSLKTSFGSASQVNIEVLLKTMEKPQQGVFKCRIVYDDKAHAVEFSPYAPKRIMTLQIVHDDVIDYSLKYADRTGISRLHQKRNKADDIVIVKHGLVTDSSYANLVFKRKGKWYTPDSPLLKGTMRAALLDRQFIEEALISVEDIKTFESFKLINAMLEFDSPEQDISNIVF